jgi:surface adhesion protein
VALNGPDANGNYSFTVPAGTTGGIQVQVQTVDDQVFEGPELLTLTATLSGSTANGTPLPAGITDTGSGTIVDQNPVEPGSESAGGKVEGVEDTELTIKWSDLKIISTKPDLGIYIASLPVNGVLKFNGEVLTSKDLEGLGKYISQADIAAGKLIFVPAANESGFDGLNGGEGEGNRMGDYASFGFRPAIGEYAGDIAKLVIDIKPVVDAPSIDLTKLTTESVRIPEIKVTVTEGSIVMSGGNVKVSGLELVTPGGSNAIGPNNKAELIDIRSGFGNITNIAAEVKDYLLLGKDFVKYKIVGSYSGGTFSGNITDLDTGKTITVSHLGGLIFADGNTSYLPSTSTTTMTTGGFDRVVVELDAMLGEDRDGSESLSDITLSGLNGATVESIVDKSGKPIAFTSNSDGTVTILNAGHTSMEDVKITIKVPLDAGNLELRAEVSANEQGLADSDKVTVSDGLSLAAYTTLTGGVGGDNLNGTGGNDLVVSDVQGLQILPGKNYNIALIVDTSGSMGATAVANAVKSLKDVVNQLIASAKGNNSGTVNLYLSDFDDKVQGSVSINLKNFVDANNDGFPDVVQALLNSMTSGGGTNYEAAFKAAANWFYSTSVTSNPGTNLTYFITDGLPTYYQANSTSGASNPDGKGGFEKSILAGDGINTTATVKQQSKEAYDLLAKVSNVDAIGLGPSLSANDLKVYDTDGVVQANIDAANLADAILGKNNNLPLGDDIVHGGNGNDILFGDQIKIGNLEGFAALQKLVADKVGGGLEASKVTVEQVHDYITKHHADFAQLETVGGGKDELHGGAGNDILYGQGGDDKLFGDEGNDILYGGTGNDYLDGGTGNDILVGGKGNDTLIGGEGDDIFVWLKGDQGTVAAPAADVVKDFGNGNDKLDLRDLLQGEEKVTDLSKFLHFGIENGSTVIKVSSAGGLTATGANFDQKITLEGVNWSAADTASAQNDLIKDLIKQGKLLVDGNHQ